METEDLINADQFCESHKIEFSFIRSLEDFGLVKITTVSETAFIPNDDLEKVEQYVRMHYDLNINLEGIDAISNLLDRVRNLQSEILRIGNRLRRYETEF
jgi:hypothetical protein